MSAFLYYFYIFEAHFFLIPFWAIFSYISKDLIVKNPNQAPNKMKWSTHNYEIILSEVEPMTVLI